MKGAKDRGQSDEFWQSERAERWVRRQPFEQLIRTYERLKGQPDGCDRVDTLMSSRRMGIELIIGELKRRREDRNHQDRIHAPLGEDPQHLQTCSDQPPLVDGSEATDTEGAQECSLEVDLFQMR